MNQERVNKIAQTHYHPLYRQHAEREDVKQACIQIVAIEKARGLDKVQTLRGVRSRIHELLQSVAPVPDPPLPPTTNATEARKNLDDHHEQQTAHFQALWMHADALANDAMSAKGN